MSQKSMRYFKSFDSLRQLYQAVHLAEDVTVNIPFSGDNGLLQICLKHCGFGKYVMSW